MKGSYWMAGLILVTLVAGCSNQDDDTSSAPQQQGQLPDDNVFSDQVRTLEKAKSVQQTLDAAAAKQREDIEQQNRP